MVGKEALRLLYEEHRNCDKCTLLCESRLQPVFGSGSASADIVFVGESPGEQEDEENETLMGKSGRLLLQLFDMSWPNPERLSELREIQDNERYFASLKDFLEEYVFFTNTILCRSAENRTPSKEEIKNCRTRLENTIYAIDPLLVIAAGKTAATTLLGKNVSILDKRGTIFDISVTSPSTGKKVRYPMLAILSPSYLLRKGDKSLVRQGQGDTHSTIQDLKYGLDLITKHYELTRPNFGL